MSEIITNQHGEASKIAANLRVGVLQGRISEGEVPKWRAFFEKNYEQALDALVSRKPNVEAGRRVKSYSEAAWDRYAVATGVVKPWQRHGGYMRSVV